MVREKYTPIVLWVDVPEDKRVHDVRSYLEDEANSLPYVTVASTNAPYKYATAGTIREEEADGNDG